MSDLWRALGYLRKYWRTSLGAFISLLIVTATNLISPQILRIVIDMGISARNLGHDKAQTGQLLTRVTNDVENVRNFAGNNGLLQLLNAIVMLLGSTVILLLTNWKLALIALTIVPILLFIFLSFIRRVRPRFLTVQQKLGNLNTILQENLAGVRVVKAFVREPYELARYRAANDNLLQENLVIVRNTSFTFPQIFFIANLGTLAIIWFGGAQVIGGQLSIGTLVAFNSYLTFLLMPVFILGSTLTSITQSAASAHRVFEVIDAPIEVTDKPGAIVLPPVQGRVEFENVSFRYAGSETLTLANVSFITKPGQTVAILGKTGSGKSSIINLIPRFYDVSGGRVMIDGHDVRDVTLASLRSQIGIVLQETNLFSGTIRENIAYGRPDASKEEIEAAARAAQAHTFITSFPDGYETLVGERGVGLSGGQRQRIAIARALLVKPAILILDDSTSAVDAETEYQIQQALQHLIAICTSFIIAERISTVRNASFILLVDDGRLVAQGTHDELLQSSTLYTQLLESQLHSDKEVVLPA